MKKIYSLSCLFFIIAISYGQSKKIEQANKLFESYQYVDAIEAYLELVKNKEADAQTYKRLADSYYSVFNIEEAAKWYATAIETKQDAETYFRYAQVLKSQGKYEAANEQMNTFAQLSPDDQRAKMHLSNPNYIPQLADKTKSFEVEETTINDSQQSDFGAVLSNDNILYFVSTRNNSKQEDRWTNQPYLDIYKSVRKDDGSLSDPEEVEELNTIYHDGPLTISADGKTMFFSRDGHSEGSFKKIKNKKVKLAQQGLYKATFVDGKWGNVQALPINSNDYTVSHPSLSSDGKTLYFASNMPGGLGDTDIWKISVNGNSYGKPQNLGPNVNTAGKEGFPFISDDNILYFASIGRQGFGGFDIFKIDLNKNEKAENLGNGINTKRDDFSFSVNTSKKIGYFSSNRSGVDQIYIAIPICKFDIIALVKHAENNTAISNANVSITDAQNNTIATQETNAKGETDFTVGCDTNYKLTVSKEGFETVSIPVSESKDDETMVKISLQPINEIITDTEVKLQNIYFEFNKSNITQQGAFELDKLVKIMNDYPNMSIKVRSHTDSKGTASYNLNLSEKRAQATVQYLISKGIDKARLSAEGIGSQEPKIDCKSNCTDEEDAQNRRSEFLIIKK
ncbi:OmpA family protein [Psychroserpens sp. SPM9]|uniref:OmpA family protein n=1 Tax=Psychroserpens sp. SPM9 TaxID=2975598 RepID=UPI0021A4147C|nr:OmpA family protein [Psychroserpens sp. SPM9]MDG5491177.1 OmpA family protein [Psychroserpens sp. SPM9]